MDGGDQHHRLGPGAISSVYILWQARVSRAPSPPTAGRGATFYWVLAYHAFGLSSGSQAHLLFPDRHRGLALWSLFTFLDLLELLSKL
ncbi:hypothetical protein MRX96_038087 [Rhipicephalus microplus]